MEHPQNGPGKLGLKKSIPSAIGNTNNGRRRKRKKTKRGKRRREEKDLVIQGRVSFGPSWFWADLVLGRVGFGPSWFGPSWFWAELTREPIIGIWNFQAPVE